MTKRVKSIKQLKSLTGMRDGDIVTVVGRRFTAEYRYVAHTEAPDNSGVLDFTDEGGPLVGGK